MRHIYYSWDGEPITRDAWVASYGDGDSRRVAATEIGDQRVSTVWLGIDHNFSDHGPPLIFETMVFPDANVCVRTPTAAAALAAHDQVVAEVRDSLHAKLPHDAE